MSVVSHAKGGAPFGFRFVAPLALGALMNPINSTMISTALAPIARDLHASVAQAGWLIAGLYLTSAVAQPTLGRLADLVGPRRVYLASLAMVGLAGVLGALAPSLAALTLVRVLLGVGTSGAYPSAMRIFRDRGEATGSAPPRTAMGVLSLTAISSMAVGPVLGGVLTAAFGWHAIFTVNAPLALLAIGLTLAWTPKDAARPGGWTRALRELDLVGVALFAAALLGAMVFLLNLDRPMWPALAGSAAAGAALVAWSLRRREPFLDVRLLAANRPLTATYLRQGALSLIAYCILYGFAQWLESAGGYSAAAAGLETIPLSVAAAVSSFTGARTRTIRTPFVICAAAALAGSLALLAVGSGSAPWLIALAVAALGVPQGMGSTAGQAAIYVQAAKEDVGAAAGLQRTFGYAGAIGATALLGAMYGRHATDAGFHHVVAVTAALSGLLLVATVLDPTLKAAVSPAAELPKENARAAQPA